MAGMNINADRLRETIAEIRSGLDIARAVADRDQARGTMEWFRAQRLELGKLAHRLNSTVQANVTERVDNTKVRIHGILASSHELSGALRNWCTAAEKRLEQLP